MECTQRLECTQELDGVRTEKTCPEQIGFLGICGAKYPVKKGPNKIGRDPQTCNIVLNLNSISRQHAVINILNQREFMLMDLDSANKTKLLDKIIHPYIPHPLKNGDTVQFGEIFGIFRLLEEDDDLPMTQAIDIPETPITIRHVSKLNKAPITNIPESPDVSDKDDSFIVLSQPKGSSKHLKNASNHHFIKPGKTISIQPIGTNKIDNIFWNSSKKSTSLSLDESSVSPNVSVKSVKNDISIYEMETQAPVPKEHNESTDSIHTANTQMPEVHSESPSIHTAETQIPYRNTASPPYIHTANTQMPEEAKRTGTPSIHSLETQLPPITEHLPEIRKINKQQDMQFDIYAANKENDNSIYNADTQLFTIEKEHVSVSKINLINDKGMTICRKLNESPKMNASDEELLFDEVDNQPLDDDFASQALLPDDIWLEDNLESGSKIQTEVEDIEMKASKRVMYIQSDNSTDCDDIDIIPTQKIPEKVDNDEDITDCEDEFIEICTNKTNKPETTAKTNIDVDFEDMATQVIGYDVASSKTDMEVNLEDMPTQVIEFDNMKKIEPNEKIKKEAHFEDLPTQVIDEDIIPNNTEREENETQPLFAELVSPFKIPLQSLIRNKRRGITKPVSKPKYAKTKSPIIHLDGDDKYYNATQDIYDDLCSQQENSPEIVKVVPERSIKNKISDVNDKLVPSSTEEHKVGDKLRHDENKLLSPKNLFLANKSSSSSDGDEKINRFVRNLSNQQIREVIGIDTNVTKLKKQSSEVSDVDVTPKKIKPFKFMYTDLPNSQEIKTSVSLNSKSLVTESSSESEIENNPEEQNTPILFRKKKKVKPDAKIDLTKIFDVEALPTRIMTRVRKPTAKVKNEESKNTSKNLLKPIYFMEQEDEIDKEIISENISRLKTKHENSKTNKDRKTNEAENEHISQKNTDKKSEKSTVKKKHNSRKKLNEKESEKVTKSTEKSKESYKTKNKESESNRDLSNISSVDTNEINKTKEIKEYIELTVESMESNKSTRSSRNKSSCRNNEKKPISPEGGIDNHSDNKRKRTTKKHVKKESSPVKDTEVRRSKRQKKDIIKKEDEPVKLAHKSILKNIKTLTHEQSTVYNISSGSSISSPKNLKRSAVDQSIVPSSKRTRSVAVSKKSLRSTPARALSTQHVLFTAFPYEEVRVKLERLGAVIVTDVASCSVVLTLQIKRTFKLLCAAGLGLPIVGPDWVQACADTNMIVDPWLYLIKDQDTEKRFGFNLHRTLTGKRNFLKGYNVSSTPSVMPNASEMKLIVECSGGTWKGEGPQWICVSSMADKDLWSSLRRRGATIVSTEFILAGVLRQKLDLEANMFK